MPKQAAENLGDTVQISQLVGDVPTILNAFEDEWAPRWQKHDDVDHTKWEPIMNFLKTAIPKRDVAFPAITLEA